MMESMGIGTEPAGQVGAWSGTADVIVVGYGIAGVCAALEPRRAGADVLVVPRASGGGGASALSAGIFYLGGGTPVQKQFGYDDPPEEIYRFLMASTGARRPANACAPPATRSSGRTATSRRPRRAATKSPRSVTAAARS